MHDHDPQAVSAPGAPGDETRPAMLLIAGFGDNASLFDALFGTALDHEFRLIPLNLPGFGAPRLEQDTTLEALADTVAEAARKTGARVIMAHSVASIIASLAARLPDCPLDTIVSLEGNITAEDAYFSGTAVNYDDPLAFRAAFLARLDGMAATSSVVARYRDNVAKADPLALWHLGRDAGDFSAKQVPGDVLRETRQVCYLFNPPNCPQPTLDWLARTPMVQSLLPDTSHWPSVDQPALLASETLRILHDWNCHVRASTRLLV